MRARAARRDWPDVGSPGSRPRSFCTCQVLRPRRAVRTLRWCVRNVLPSALETASAPGDWLSRLNGWPMPSPADASPASLRMPTHGSGPMWIATPSSYWTCTTYSLPVSRRTSSDTHQSRRPLILARRADDLCAKRHQKTVQFIDVGTLAGAEAEVMQTDALLLERCAFILG